MPKDGNNIGIPPIHLHTEALDAGLDKVFSQIQIPNEVYKTEASITSFMAHVRYALETEEVEPTVDDVTRKAIMFIIDPNNRLRDMIIELLEAKRHLKAQETYDAQQQKSLEIVFEFTEDTLTEISRILGKEFEGKVSSMKDLEGFSNTVNDLFIHAEAVAKDAADKNAVMEAQLDFYKQVDTLIAWRDSDNDILDVPSVKIDSRGINELLPLNHVLERLTETVTRYKEREQNLKNTLAEYDELDKVYKEALEVQEKLEQELAIAKENREANQEAQKKIAELEEELENVKNELIQANDKITDLTQKLDSEKIAKQQLESEKNSLTKEKEEALKKVEDLTVQLSNAQQELKFLTLAKNDLETRLEQMQTENLRLNEEVTNLETQLKNLEVELESFKDQVATADKAILASNQENQKLRKSLEDAKQKADDAIELRKKLESFIKNIEDLLVSQSYKKALDWMNAVEQGTKILTTEENKENKSSIFSFKTKKEEKIPVFGDIKVMFNSRFKTSWDEYKTFLEEKVQEEQEQKTAMAALETRIDSLLAHLKIKENELKGLGEEIERIVGERTRLENDLRDISEQLSQKESLIQRIVDVLNIKGEEEIIASINKIISSEREGREKLSFVTNWLSQELKREVTNETIAGAIGEISNNIEKLRATIRAKESENKRLQGEVKSLTDTKKALQEKNGRLIEKNRKLTEDLESIRADLGNAENEIERQKKEIEKLKKEGEDNQAIIEMKNRELEAKEAVLSQIRENYESQIQRLTQDFEQRISELRQSHKHEVEEYEATIKDLRLSLGEKEGIEHALEIAEKSLIQLREELQDANNMIFAKNANIQELTKMKEQLELKNEELQKELDEERAKKERVEAEFEASKNAFQVRLASLTKDLEGMRVTLQTKIRELAQSEAKNQELQEELERKLELIKEQEDMIESFSVQLQEKNDQITQNKQTIEELNKKLEEIEAILKNRDATIEGLTKANQELGKNLDHIKGLLGIAQSQRNKARADAERLAGELEELQVQSQADLDRLSQDLAAQKEALENERRLLEESMEENKDLSEELKGKIVLIEEKEKLIQALKNSLDEKDGEITLNKEELKVLKERLRSLNELLKNKNSNIKELKSANEELQNSLNKNEKLLGIVKAQRDEAQANAEKLAKDLDSMEDIIAAAKRFQETYLRLKEKHSDEFLYNYMTRVERILTKGDKFSIITGILERSGINWEREKNELEEQITTESLLKSARLKNIK